MNLKRKFPDEFFKEETATFVVDGERKRLWAALMDLLAEFDRVCRKHGVRYSIDGGTMLGKARHNGIIPWDDDIDVIMMRADYEKLKAVAAEEFKTPYFLQTMESDPEACRGHPQFRNGSMTMILKGEFKDGKAIYKTFNQGLFMDVFVLDAIPDDEGERKAYFAELAQKKGMMYLAREWKHDYRQVSIGLTPRKLVNYYRSVKAGWIRAKLAGLDTLARIPYALTGKYQLLVKALGTDPLVHFQREFEKACRRYEGVVTRDVSHVQLEPDPKPSRIFAREKLVDDGESREMTGRTSPRSKLRVADVGFMGLKVQMLKEWAYYLEHLYGDWHKCVIGTAVHGGLVLDLDRPYTEYF